ncbi:MAG: hypothetical protein ACRELW_17375 [Candidatus Rokuibacteriota bacterium]
MGERRKKRGKVKGKEFLDVAREAFVRHLALDKYREMEDMKATLDFDDAGAAEDACTFLERGPYRMIWRRHWQAIVVPAAAQSSGAALLPAVEQALSAALAEEEQARQAQGDRPLDEEPEYKRFIDRSMDRLHHEACGEIERLDDE